ncbi:MULTISPECIES: hypothetical protein [unclassified Chelatococcus]|uniref:hypothetical protein n=1 Tax=unclassified Chelatococcus TaxID=2638111 RepID=UPI001BD00290|nr:MULTISPECIES: hypothetical protein [unclassified Chelatococcus]MBS7700162.1 hypothetical protein [Chelatococcus sp. YT9]MBX3556855.1 hypothetical protein [Chelatococcus sp.]
MVEAREALGLSVMSRPDDSPSEPELSLCRAEAPFPCVQGPDYRGVENGGARANFLS